MLRRLRSRSGVVYGLRISSMGSICRCSSLIERASAAWPTIASASGGTARRCRRSAGGRGASAGRRYRARAVQSASRWAPRARSSTRNRCPSAAPRGTLSGTPPAGRPPARSAPWAPASPPAIASREWSSRRLQISTSLPSPRRQWVTSDCQHSFGSCASNRIHELRGACGAGGSRTPADAAPASWWRP
jgi:hypothetical protein